MIFVLLFWDEEKEEKKNYENKMCTSRKINEISAREHNLIGYLLVCACMRTKKISKRLLHIIVFVRLQFEYNIRIEYIRGACASAQVE